MKKRQYLESIACLTHWGRIKAADLLENQPGVSQPPTSKDHVATGKTIEELLNNPLPEQFIADEGWFNRADDAVNRLSSDYREAIQIMFRENDRHAFPSSIKREAVGKFWAAYK